MKNNITHNKIEKLPMFYCIISIISLQPYFVWNTKWISLVIPITCFMFSIIYLKQNFDLNIRNIFIAIFYIFIIVYFNITLKSVKDFIFTLYLQTPVILYLLGNKNFKIKTYKYFVVFFAVSLVPAIIVFIINFMGIDFSYRLIEPLNKVKSVYGVYYKEYLGAVVSNVPNMTKNYGGIIFNRICGMYDEPGVVGTICGILLIIEKLDLKKTKNKIILIGGLFSFSLAFYILLIINLFITKRIKIIIGFLIFIIILNFSSLNTENGVFDDLIFNRIKISENKMSGDNRVSPELEYQYNLFLKGDIKTILIGKGSDYIKDNIDGGISASYKNFVYERGLICFGLFLILVFLLYYTSTSKINNYYIFLAFLLSIYQRPYIFILAFIVLIVGGTLYNSENMEPQDAVAKLHRNQ